MTYPARLTVAVLLFSTGCGPSVLGPADDTHATTTQDADSSTTAAAPPSDESDSTGAIDSTGAPPPLTAGASFLDNPDAGGAVSECDLFTQDCPPGEKCMPWANDGGSSWNATRCSPIAKNPGGAGDPCTVEGTGTSGIDDCQLGAMCWDVDTETNEGTCIDLCTGDIDNPVCEDPETYCVISSDGALLPCLPSCDPLASDCPDDQGCYPWSSWWSCGPDASGDIGAYGDPCEFLNACDPGLVCLNPQAVPGCESGVGCCSEACSLDMPLCTGAPEGQECVPWYDPDDPPPSFEDLGVCSVP